MGSGAGTNANVWVDISETIELKKQALAAHPSQLSEEVAEFAGEMARGQAEGHAFEYAEAFPPHHLRPAPARSASPSGGGSRSGGES